MGSIMKAVVAVLTLAIVEITPYKLSAQARPYGAPAIFTIDKDGTNTKFLVSVPQMQWHGTPSWSHDGKWIVFDASPGWRIFNRSHVYICNAAGKKLRDLGRGNSASWSPDGKMMAYHIYPNTPKISPPGIWVMHSDGTQKRWLCDGDRPRWSPDGKKLVVMRNDPAALYLVNFKTLEEERVLFESYQWVTGADFSPDGKSLVFIGYRDGFPQGELGIVVRKKKEWVFRIRHEGRIGFVPSWSPDGKRIVFYTVSDKFSRQLHTISSNGKEPPLRLTSHDNVIYNTDASWSLIVNGSFSLGHMNNRKTYCVLALSNCQSARLAST